MEKAVQKNRGRERRHARIRAKIVGSAARPRLCVYKSNRYLHAQIIDDEKGVTLAAGSTKEMPKEKKMQAARSLGGALAARAKEAGITAVVFDRGGFRFAGRISELAQAAREAGLEF